MDTAGFIHHLTTQQGYSDQIVHTEVIPARKAVYGEPTFQSLLLKILLRPPARA